jgi:hypothetical protein
MSRNLISLSTLDAEGFKYSGSGGVFKVSKGSLVCLVGDMNSTKLYVIRGSTLHGSISAAAAVTDDKPCETNLWHMCLGTWYGRIDEEKPTEGLYAKWQEVL